MVAQELNDSRLTLVEGSLLSERDLVRLHADTAHAILLLADRFSASARNEDLQLQFQASLARRPAPTSFCIVPAAYQGLHPSIVSYCR